MKKNESLTWIRLPTKGRCPRTGLCRSHFYSLIDAGDIRSSCLKRNPNARTGVRLVALEDVLEYIQKNIVQPVEKSA